MHEQASRPPSSRLSQFEHYTQSLRPSESTSSSHVTTSGSSHSKIHQIRSLAHFRELIGTTKQDSLYPHHDMDPLIVMEFTAPWCKACQVLRPVLTKLAKENYPSCQVMVAQVSVDQFPTLAQEYHIAALPTCVLFRRGQVLEKCRGADAFGLFFAIHRHAKQQA